MKLRQGFLLVVLVLLGGTLCRGQTTFVTGNLTAAAAACTTAPSNTNHVTISTIGFGGATFTASGGWAGTVSFYASGDGGITWQPLNVTPSSSTTPVTTTTTVGLWQANVSGYTHVCMLASAFSSGTIAVRIHCSTVSARAGGGGGGGSGGPITPPAGSLTGQTLTVAGTSVIGSSPGILDSPSSPVTAATFTPACGTTNIGDRAHIIVLGPTGTTVTIPLSTATNCANSIFYFLAQGTETFQPSGAEVLDVYNGAANYTACASGCTAPNLQIPAGSYATIDNGSGTTWHCLVETNAATGGTGGTLDSITSAVSSPAPLANAAFTIPWNWTLTGAGAGLAIGETAASTGATASGNLNNQSILQVSTAAGSTASPLVINQGTLTTTANPAALQIQSTWNNAGLSAQGLIIQANCMACNVGSSLPLAIYNGAGATQFSVASNGAVFNTGTITTNGNFNALSGLASANAFSAASYRSSGTGTNAVFQGGNDTSSTTVIGAGIFKGGDNSSTSTTASPGSLVLRAGLFTGGPGTPASAIQGTTEVASNYFGTGIAAVGDVVCATATQFQVTDCPLGAVNIVGVTAGTTLNVSVVAYGTVPVRLSAAMTALGDIVCMSTTTVGQAVDSGSKTAACATGGAQVGVIVANTGTVTIASSATATTTTVALSTTYPLVQLHIR